MYKKVLIHGGDVTLLETRRQILLKGGLDVDTILNRSVLVDQIAASKPDLLVLCSSLPSDVKQHDLEVAHSTRPQLKCLVVDAPTHPESTGTAQDTIFPAFDGPERFLKTVFELLAV